MQFLGLVVFNEILVAVDEHVAEVGVELEDFLETAVFESSGERMLVQSVVLFDYPVSYVLFWLTYEEF